jgi:hypothetical protein
VWERATLVINRQAALCAGNDLLGSIDQIDITWEDDEAEQQPMMMVTIIQSVTHAFIIWIGRRSTRQCRCAPRGNRFLHIHTGFET